MGFSITAAAVTVTVATSDMLRFCKMKFLQMSIHRSPCEHYLRRKTTFFLTPIGHREFQQDLVLSPTEKIT